MSLLLPFVNNTADDIFSSWQGFLLKFFCWGWCKNAPVFQIGGEAFLLHFWPLFRRISDGYKYLKGG